MRGTRFGRFATCALLFGVISISRAIALDDSVPLISFRITFGLKDTAERPWHGRVIPAAGQVLSIEADHFRAHNYTVSKNPEFPADYISDDLSWKCATRAAWLRSPDRGMQLQVPSLLLHIWRNPPGGKVRIETVQGPFSFDPSRITSFEPVFPLEGSVLVERVPAVSPVAPEQLGQQDFPSVLVTRAGEIWVCWQEHKDGFDSVYVRRHSGERWQSPEELAAKSDVFRTALAEDRAGHIWAIWAMQVNRRWDLYGRRRENGGWSRPQKLTGGSSPNIFHAVVTDAKGGLWVAWQGALDGTSQIFAKHFDGRRRSEDFLVSDGRARNGNNWWPAVSAGPDGSVAIVWDGYAAGNYDVYARMFRGEAWDPVRAVAATAHFEANPSVAVDQRNRVWVAWQESGVDWGKDTGHLVTRQGTRLYEPRRVRVACLDGGRILGTPEPPPPAEGDPWELPQLRIDGRGYPWLVVRHILMRMPDSRRAGSGTIYAPLWETYASRYDGRQWTRFQYVPRSSGRNDMLAAAASAAEGGLWLTWATDHRNTMSYSSHEQAQLMLARIGGESATPQAEFTLAPYRETAPPASEPIHAAEKEDLDRIRAYRIQLRGKTYSIYRGDLHRHTELSWDGGGDGSLLDAYRYARDAARLDFLGISDHNEDAAEPYLWWLSQKYADLFHTPNLATLYGYERSVEYPNGHRNIFFAQRGIPVLPVLNEEAQGWDGAGRLFWYLRRNGGTSIPHTSASSSGTDWRDHDPKVEHLVEIYQGMRDSAEYPGAPQPKTLATSSTLEQDNAPWRRFGTVWSALAKGYKLGFIASSDHLSTHVSYACVIAERLTRDDLLAAIRARRVYAATDNLILDVQALASDGRHLMGEEFSSETPVRLEIRVVGTGEIRQVDVIRNNRIVYTSEPHEREIRFQYAAKGEEAKCSYYYVRVMQKDGEMAWGSPIWVARGNGGVP
jgi:hypothetical protein